MNSRNKFFIIDFDCVFVGVESLDTLAGIVLSSNPDSEKIVTKIENITNLGMEGKLSFNDSLRMRLNMLSINKEHINKLVSELKNRITPSIRNNKNFFIDNRESIYIVSGGFKEYIRPVVKNYGVTGDHVLANSFIFGDNGNVIGLCKNNPLAYSGGKAKTVKDLSLNGEIFVIGDGYTDYEIKKEGAADKFFAFTENVYRENVVDNADYALSNFDEFLKFLKNNN